MRSMQKTGVFLSGMLLISGLVGSLSAKALDNNIYTAKCTPYYIHPVTGIVEDRGGADSVGIGQPMTDSATYPEALIEVDPDGNVFATVRLSLMDNIENVAFQVQADGNAPFYDVSYDVMQENLDNNTTDFRMQIPSENSYLRAAFYVVPMSRDVIYYIGFSDFQEGSSDFITSVEVIPEAPPEEPHEEPAEENPAEPETEAAVETQPETTTAVQSTEAETTASETETESQTETETSTAVTTTTAETTTAYTENGDDPMPSVGGNADNPGNGIMIYDEKGNLMQLSDVIGGTSAEITTEPEQNNNSGFGVGVLAGVGGAAVIGGIIFAVARKKGSQ